ncbi:MAG: DUF2939 domain-containing protein [Nitrospinota bacterium]|nr:DUF2939 domain-containing protein [Nitrospinota bacterium]
MPEAPVKSPQRPKLMIRRGKKVTEGVEVQTVFADIKSGQLKPSHEFSMDGVLWRRLDSHPQLAKVFEEAPKPKASSKSGLVLGFFLIFLLIVGLYFHPYIAFYNVQISADSGNVGKLSQWVNYSDLHRNIKSQLDGQWQELVSGKTGKTPYDKSAETAGRRQVDKMTNAMVTPEAVMDFSKGKTEFIGSWADEKVPGKKAPVAGTISDPWSDLGMDIESVNRFLDSVNNVLAQADLSYQDVNTFVAAIKTDKGETIQFLYQRDGIDWKLGGITLPSGSVRSSLDSIVQSALKDARGKARVSNSKKKPKEESKGQAKVAKRVESNKAYMANLELTGLTVGKGKKYIFNSPNPGVFATLKNNGDQTLKEVEITIYFYNSKGVIVSEKKLYPVSVSKYRPGRDNDPLEPGNSKKIGYLVKEFSPPTWAGKVTMRVTNIILKN